MDVQKELKKEHGYRPPVFDEYALLKDVCKKWGAHGAHAEVLRDLIERAKSKEVK